MKIKAQDLLIKYFSDQDITLRFNQTPDLSISIS